MASKLSVATEDPPRPATVPDLPLPEGRNIPREIRHHAPAWQVKTNTRRKLDRPGELLPYIQHVATEPERVNLQRKLPVNVEWSTQQKKRRPAKLGKRKDDGLEFKYVARCHKCVVFNASQGCTTDTVKSYIVYNGLDVLDIKRLSDEE